MAHTDFRLYTLPLDKQVWFGPIAMWLGKRQELGGMINENHTSLNYLLRKQLGGKSHPSPRAPRLLSPESAERRVQDGKQEFTDENKHLSRGAECCASGRGLAERCRCKGVERLLRAELKLSA